MKLYEAISQRIKDLLEERNYIQADLFKKGGIPRTTISNIINGNRQKMCVDTIYQICSTLDITLSEFFDDPLFDEVDD